MERPSLAQAVEPLATSGLFDHEWNRGYFEGRGPMLGSSLALPETGQMEPFIVPFSTSKGDSEDKREREVKMFFVRESSSNIIPHVCGTYIPPPHFVGAYGEPKAHRG